jgi:hypothetical protein
VKLRAAAAIFIPLVAVAVGAVVVMRRSSQSTPLIVAPIAGLAPVPTDRLTAAGQPAFWAGLNYPWKTGQDFGTGGWGHSGVSDSTTYREIDADFANMAAQGVRVVKWRIFSDGRYGLQFGDNGNVTGLDEFFFPDLDAALEIAKRHDLYLVFTLFSSGFWTADCQSGQVHLGGQASTLTDPTKRQALIDHVGHRRAEPGAGRTHQSTAGGRPRLCGGGHPHNPPAQPRASHGRVQPLQQYAHMAGYRSRLLQFQLVRLARAVRAVGNARELSEPRPADHPR